MIYPARSMVQMTTFCILILSFEQILYFFDFTVLNMLEHLRTNNGE
jgi:hypothetical protein